MAEGVNVGAITLRRRRCGAPSSAMIDSPNANGKVVNWALELPPPNVLQRNGFNRGIYETLMNSHEAVTVTAYAAKDGSKHAWAGGLTRSDGQTVISLGGIPPQGGGRGGRGGPGGPGGAKQ